MRRPRPRLALEGALITLTLSVWGCGPAESAQIKVACVQMRLQSSVPANVSNTISHIQTEAAQGTRLVVFPECSLTDYSAAILPGITQATIDGAIAQVAAACDDNDVYAVVGTPYYEDSTRFNAAVVIGPDGQIVHRYYKMHVVMPSVFADGNELGIFSIDGIPATIFVCHDERYPELMRIGVYGGARIAIYIAFESAEPTKEFNYRCQIVGRAVENQTWVLACNAPVGNDSGNSHGQSRIIGPDGTVHAEAGAGEAVIRHTIETDESSDAWVQQGAATWLWDQFWEEGLRVLQSQNLDYFGSVTADPLLQPDIGVLGSSPSTQMATALVQMRMSSDPATNAAQAVSFIQAEAAQGTRVVVFPQCALTDRDPAGLPGVSQTQLDAALDQVASACDANNVYAIVGSPFRQDDKLYDGAYVIDPSGAVIKRHAQMHTDLPGVFDEGERMSLFKIDNVYATVLVGHDIHYPELSRSAVLAGARVIFCLAYEAAGTDPYASESQVVCRAVESQTYVVFCNAGAGNDAGDSTGHSRIVSPSAVVHVEAGTGSDVVVRHTINTGASSSSYARRGADTPSLQDYWQESLDIVRLNNPEFYGDPAAPPIVAAFTPNPDRVFAGLEYVRQLTLVEGYPPPAWSVVEGPAGAQVDDDGRVAQWTPGPDQVGDWFTFQVQARNVYGADGTTWDVRVDCPGDFDGDRDVDQQDFGRLQACLGAPGTPPAGPGCQDADLDGDEDVDQADFGVFETCMSGANVIADPQCADNDA